MVGGVCFHLHSFMTFGTVSLATQNSKMYFYVASSAVRFWHPCSSVTTVNSPKVYSVTRCLLLTPTDFVTPNRLSVL